MFYVSWLFNSRILSMQTMCDTKAWLMWISVYSWKLLMGAVFVQVNMVICMVWFCMTITLKIYSPSGDNLPEPFDIPSLHVFLSWTIWGTTVTGIVDCNKRIKYFLKYWFLYFISNNFHHLNVVDNPSCSYFRNKYWRHHSYRELVCNNSGNFKTYLPPLPQLNFLTCLTCQNWEH
jgi:hypothetical protein